MKAIHIEILDDKVMAILQSLEELKLIRVRQPSEQDTEQLEEKYAGKLPTQVAEDMQDYVKRSRKEWKK
ncbi:MAG: hypothetical protein LC670_08040 [Flavobacteriales bacterium]|nr:hypothetical protein [Flavobacteriales bacterium]